MFSDPGTMIASGILEQHYSKEKPLVRGHARRGPLAHECNEN
jgi:hypothetical protein